MPSIYVINVGANMRHQGKAKSPLFSDGSFTFVSFPTDHDCPGSGYSAKALKFVRSGHPASHTHADPDWENLTYGDCCKNARASALKKVVEGDILLFWGLLWENTESSWQDFTGNRGWYLLGALRVKHILRNWRELGRIPTRYQKRIRANAHAAEGNFEDGVEHIFAGDTHHSCKFDKAVDLQVRQSNGLLFRTFTSKSGELLSIDKRPAWPSSLRACRKMWDLESDHDLRRARVVRDAILKRNDFDLLSGV